MSAPSKKFNSVRATRLSLLLAISLTAGIGAAIYRPLDLAQQGQVVRASQITPATATASPTIAAGTSTATSPDPSASTFDNTATVDTTTVQNDPQSSFGAASASSLNSDPQAVNVPLPVQTTQAPVLTTTQGS